MTAPLVRPVLSCRSLHVRGVPASLQETSQVAGMTPRNALIPVPLPPIHQLTEPAKKNTPTPIPAAALLSTELPPALLRLLSRGLLSVAEGSAHKQPTST
jgi:hypothetical protein